MINNIISRAGIRSLTVIALLLSVSSFAQINNYDKYCEQSSLVINQMEKHHISPLEINDVFSSKVFETIIEILDEHKIYFTQSDIAELKKFEHALDDELTAGKCDFLKKLIPLYKTRLLQGDSLVNAILSKKMDYSIKSKIIFEAKSTSKYAINAKKMKERWTKWLKYLTLESMAKSHFINDEKGTLSKESLLKFEQESRDKIRTKYENLFKNYLENNDFYEDLIAETYFLSITTTFDPHSMYFSPEVKEYFVGGLSKEEKSLGIEFEENELGDVMIERLVPGGPSWKSNQINVGDLVLGIKWPENSWMDLSFVSVEELNDMLLINSDEVVLKIKKTNGKVIEVPLMKEMIRADENIIKSFVLKSDQSIGYISLPGFYTEFEGQNQLGCANDIAKSILKMQKENIDGLIIDLRNNGGGSLKEAIELSGIFIDFGPLTIFRSKDEKPVTIKDINRGSIYNDPLLILVNAKSASASEMFAATMQDYSRAVIVGSTTFGKSTGQDIIPLKESLSNNESEFSDMGYVKITTSMFYRLNQVSYQKVGVVPDIPIPFLSLENEFRESDYPSVLDSGSISKRIYMPEITELPYEELLNNSKKRIANDTIFEKIKSINTEIENKKIDSLLIPLSIKEFILYKKKDNSSKNSILGELEERATSNYTINEITYDIDVLKMDEYKKEINQISINRLEKDIYLDEAYHIILDLIKIKNK